MLKQGYLLIADISGYTEFIKLHNMREKPVVGKPLASFFESHAEIVISDLLESVIDAIEPDMQLNKLEGDAAFFFCEESNDVAHADKIFSAMERAIKSFNKKASELVFVQACGCEPCSQSKNLRLKIVAHRGEFTIKKIRQFEEIAGEAVILVHRMLKNNIKSREYWLVTDSFYHDLSTYNAAHFTKVIENIDSFGEIPLHCREFNSEDPFNPEIEAKSRVANWFKQAGYFSKSTARRFLKSI